MHRESPPMPAALKQRLNVASLFAVAAASFVVRVAYCIVHGTFGLTPDNYREYILAGTGLLTRGIYMCPLAGETANLAPSAWMPPLYVAVVAGVYSLFGVESKVSTVILQLINAGATSLASVFIFLAVARLANRRAAWIAALVAAVHPLLVGFTDVLWDTSLFIMATAGVIWFSTWLSSRDTRARLFFAFGLSLGAAAMLNPALTIAYPLFVLRPVFVRNGRDFRRLIRPVTAAVVGWILVVAPWCIRDSVALGRTYYVRSNFWHEVWLGVCPEADTARSAVFNERFAMRSATERQRLIAMGEVAYVDDCKSHAIESIESDPLRYLRLSADRFTDFWLGTIRTHSHSTGEWFPRDRSRAGIMIWLCLELVVIAAGLIAAGPVRAAMFWLLSIVAIQSIIYGFTHVELRYRAQFEPAIVIALGIAVETIGCRFSPRNKHI